MKAALVIVAGLILAFFAFSAVKPSNKEKQEAVFYYPRANVYHDLAEGDYFFYHSEQKEWIATKRITGEQESSLGEKVAVEVNSPVWKNNYQERLVFSVDLYARPTELKKQYIEDSLRLVSKKKAVVAENPTGDTVTATPEKPKKGLKKFFDKLFGKKDQE